MDEEARKLMDVLEIILHMLNNIERQNWGDRGALCQKAQTLIDEIKSELT